MDINQHILLLQELIQQHQQYQSLCKEMLQCIKINADKNPTATIADLYREIFPTWLNRYTSIGGETL